MRSAALGARTLAKKLGVTAAAWRVRRAISPWCSVRGTAGCSFHLPDERTGWRSTVLSLSGATRFGSFR
jgi:hypothetical protein